MSSAIFNTIKAIEDDNLHFYIERTRPDTVRLSVTLVGKEPRSIYSRMIILKFHDFAVMNPLKAGKSCWHKF